MVASMSLLGNDMLFELSNDELFVVDGGDVLYDIGYGVGVALGLVYDAMLILRAVYYGSF